MVAIVAILCALAIPIYLNYIARARVVSHLYPGLHAIESNIALAYAATGTMPTDLGSLTSGADTRHFQVEMVAGRLKITIASPDKLGRMNGEVMYARPKNDGSKIVLWAMSGTLAYKLGISE